MIEVRDLVGIIDRLIGEVEDGFWFEGNQGKGIMARGLRGLRGFCFGVLIVMFL